MKYVHQDMLALETGVLCHQTNCRKTMGTGIAKAIRDKWPKVYHEYCEFPPRLGNVQFVNISDGLWVANCFGQDHYGRDRRYTNYEAIASCMTKLGEIKSNQVYIPYLMGCSNAGGSWDIVSSIIEELCPNAIVCHPTLTSPPYRTIKVIVEEDDYTKLSDAAALTESKPRGMASFLLKGAIRGNDPIDKAIENTGGTVRD